MSEPIRKKKQQLIQRKSALDNLLLNCSGKFSLNEYQATVNNTSGLRKYSRKSLNSSCNASLSSNN